MHRRAAARSSASVVLPTPSGPASRMACGGAPATIAPTASRAAGWPRVYACFTPRSAGGPGQAGSLVAVVVVVFLVVRRRVVVALAAASSPSPAAADLVVVRRGFGASSAPDASAVAAFVRRGFLAGAGASPSATASVVAGSALADAVDLRVLRLRGVAASAGASLAAAACASCVAAWWWPPRPSPEPLPRRWLPWQPSRPRRPSALSGRAGLAASPRARAEPRSTRSRIEAQEPRRLPGRHVRHAARDAARRLDLPRSPRCARAR